MSAAAASGVIDVHHHVLPPDYIRRLGERIGFQGLTGAMPPWTPEASLEAMDRNGIGFAVTSISAPGFWFGDIEETKALARACNEFAAQMKRRHPGRFGFFAGVPMPDVDASLAELSHAYDRLDADGIALMTNYSGRYPGDPEFAPLFDELHRRRAVVFMHPTAAGYGRYMEEIPPPTLEFPFDTTRAITSLVFSGVLSRCRDVRVIVPHAGGAAPFLAHRIGRLTRTPAFREKALEDVLPALRRLYYDTALSANPIAFGPLLQVADPARIVFGSDYPHAGEPTLRDSVRGLRDLALAPELLHAIESGNARTLLPSATGSTAPIR